MTAESGATRILVVEDDPEIAEPLLFGLRREGFAVFHAADGRGGLDLARRERPDIVLLDVMLPSPSAGSRQAPSAGSGHGLDGFGVCRTLRRESPVPIIMLTARGQELDRVMGLELGADDYVVKPFSFRELVARVRATLRRRELDRGAAPAPADRLEVGEIVLDRTARRAWRAGEPVELTQREFTLLAVLMEQPGRAVPRQELLDRVWGEDWVGDTRTLDVHVRWLREKLEADPSTPRYIQTVRGYGYRLADPTVAAAAR